MTRTTSDTAATPEPAPTDLDGLITLLHPTPRRDRDTIRALLAEQLQNEDEAWKLFDVADDAVRHAEDIDQVRAELRAAVTTAQDQIARAAAKLDTLTGNLYDIDFAQSSTTAADMRPCLIDAARLMRAVDAFNPGRIEAPARP